MKELLNSFRALFAWEIDRNRTSQEKYSAYLIERNSVTGKTRWCWKTPARSAPDDWKPGLPEHKERPTPPSGGSSGVKPAPSWRDQGALREALQNVEREIAASPPEKPARRLSITPAPAGGFIVGEQQNRHSMPFFANRYAGNLADCLNFIEAELTEEAAA